MEKDSLGNDIASPGNNPRSLLDIGAAPHPDLDAGGRLRESLNPPGTYGYSTPVDQEQPQPIRHWSQKYKLDSLEHENAMKGRPIDDNSIMDRHIADYKHRVKTDRLTAIADRRRTHELEIIGALTSARVFLRLREILRG